jgi:small subunit ribosomal protein S16
MVKIRLARFGKKKQPIYRIVAADISAPRDGRYLERLGWYNPRANDGDEKIKVNVDRVNYWLGVGAKPTERVRHLIKPFLEGEAQS